MMGKRILMERIENLDERLCELRYDFNLALKKIDSLERELRKGKEKKVTKKK